MLNMSFDLTTLAIFVLLTFTVYAVIMVVYINAERKYKGGIVGKVIQFIIATVGFLLLSDIALILIPISDFQIGYTVHVFLKICAMTCLAVGGLKLLAR